MQIPPGVTSGMLKRILAVHMDVLSQASALSEALAETPALRERRARAARALHSLSKPNRALSASPSADGTTVALLAAASDAEVFTRITAVPFSGLDSADVLASARTLLEERVGTLLAEDSHGLRRDALLTRGFCIIVPEGVRLSAPLRLFWTSSDAWAATHLVVILGAGAELTVAEELAGAAGGEWSHACEAFAGPESRLTLSHLQIAASDSRIRVSQRARLEAGARMQWVNASAGSSELDHDVETLLSAPDASADVAWLAYARGTERMALSARNRFEARGGGGRITMRAAAEERARVRCDGLIRIGPSGGGTDTYLTQEVLMLDSTAYVDAVPGLEIVTNDVKASHSATVSRLTAEDLFYFAARGIPERVARAMAVEGFLGDLASRAGDTRVSEAVMAAIAAKYKGGGDADFSRS